MNNIGFFLLETYIIAAVAYIIALGVYACYKRKSEKFPFLETFITVLVSALVWPVCLGYLTYLDIKEGHRIKNNSQLCQMHLDSLKTWYRFNKIDDISPYVTKDVIDIVRDMLPQLVYTPIEILPTRTDSIQMEWTNDHDSYMEMNVYRTITNILIIPYYSKTIKLPCQEILKLQKKYTYSTGNIKQINEIIDLFMDGYFENKVKSE